MRTMNRRDAPIPDDRSDVVEFLRRANPVDASSLPDPTSSAEARQLLESIVSSSPETTLHTLPRRIPGVHSARRVVALAGTLLLAILLVPTGRGAVQAAVSEVGSWFDAGVGAIVNSAGNEVGRVHANGIITSAVPDGEGGWFIAGAFTAVDSTPRAHLAHIGPDGSLDPSWTPSLSGPGPADYTYASLAAGAGRVYVAGTFSEVNGQSVGNVASLDATAGALIWGANVDASEGIGPLTLSGSRVYVGLGGVAETDTDEGIKCRLIALRAEDGAPDPEFRPNIESIGEGGGGCVQALAASDSRLYVGGSFTAVDGARRAGLVALNPSTGALDPAFVPDDLDCDVGQGCSRRTPAVTALALSGDALYVAGEFNGVGDFSRTGLAFLDSNSGRLNQEWNPRVVGGGVLNLLLDGSRLYIGGDFKMVDDVPRNGFAALDATTGEPVATWNPPTTTTYIASLALSGSSVFAGGVEQSPSP